MAGAGTLDAARRSGSFRFAAPLLLLAVAVATRWPQFGRLDLSDGQLDELFYALAGDRLLHGALPVVDIWDRKPPGLFLVYALAALPRLGTLGYQLLATASAAATAEVIRRIALGFSTPLGALLAGIAYLAWLLPFQGAGGQSPVFYNLPIAVAAALTLRAARSTDARRIARLGLGAAALGGVAIQIKYTALFEAAALSVAVLWRLKRIAAPTSRLAGTIATMAVLGCLPTIAAVAVYAEIGHLGDFIYADFLSIGDRGALPRDAVADGLLFIAVIGAPLIACLPAGVAALPRDIRPTMLVWLAGAAVGFAAIGNFYHHYALPLLVPVTVAAATLLGQGIRGGILAVVLILWPLGCSDYASDVSQRAKPDGVRILAVVARPYLHGRCLFVYDGPAALYTLTDSCLPSRIAYPDHFANAVEAHALGIDIVAETARVLATNPVIVTTDRFAVHPVDRATYVLVADKLARDYVRVGSARVRGRTLHLDVPRALAPAAPPARLAAHPEG